MPDAGDAVVSQFRFPAVRFARYFGHLEFLPASDFASRCSTTTRGDVIEMLC